MKKILIITYYWPPKGGVGVQRWLKLAKYLSGEGYDITIYTAKDGETSLEDNALSKSVPSELTVIERKIFEPQKLFSLFGKKKFSSDFLLAKKKSLFKRLLFWIRANFFVPDARAFWVKPSSRYLNKYLNENPVDVVISTGPPHSMHLIAMKLKRKHSFRWIADFRDPWTNIEYFDNLPLMQSVINKHKRLEKKVLKEADLILTVSPSWAEDFRKSGAENVEVITNGFDSDDYDYSIQKESKAGFTIGYFGLYNAGRDHSFFWDALRKLGDKESKFKEDVRFLFAGEVHHNFFNNLSMYGFEDNLEYHSYLNHGETIKCMMKCDLLLVSQGAEKAINGRIPAKVFEYIGAKRPILAIGEKGSDLQKIIDSVSFAWFVEFGDALAMKEAIAAIYQLRNSKEGFDDSIVEFSRAFQAKQVIELMESL